jgi:hypothetical protein
LNAGRRLAVPGGVAGAPGRISRLISRATGPPYRKSFGPNEKWYLSSARFLVDMIFWTEGNGWPGGQGV